MSSQKLTRRDFIRAMGLASAALLAGNVLSACAPEESTAARIPATAISTTGTGASLDGTPDVEIVLKATPDEAQILPGAPTRVWRYHGEVIHGPSEALRVIPDSYLGPIFQMKKGQTVRIHFSNELPQESIVHWHGLHVPVEADGHPRLAIQPGETYTYNFTVADRAGTYWYHPHPHGRTGLQAYYGLAGLFLISDDEEQGLGLPSGDYDIPLVIQDRAFDETNQLVYGTGMMTQLTGFLGNHILVNGQPEYKHPVSAHPYRLRLLNGSNSRIYKLGWEDGTPLTVIATDGGLLEKPIQRDAITLAPAQRIELWVDFNEWGENSEIRLINLPSAAPGNERSFPVMAFQVGEADNDNTPPVLPERLSSHTLYNEDEAVNRRSPRDFTLAMGRGMNWAINGRIFEMTKVARDEIVKLGDLEVWQFFNQVGGGMGMMGSMNLPHPMHIHGLQFQVIDRQIDRSSRADWSTLSDGYVDEGWHDTVLVMPGEQVKILLKFEDFTGLYLYHCHNLEHEDMGMMRNYRVDA